MTLHRMWTRPLLLGLVAAALMTGGLVALSTPKAKAADTDFISVWTPAAAASHTVTLPLIDGREYNMNVDWGDGSNEDVTGTYSAASPVAKNYGNSTERTVTISALGDPGINGWNFGNATDDNRDQLDEISQWGAIKIIDGTYAFKECNNLDVTAQDAPDLTGVTNLQGFFEKADSLAGTTANWNSWDMSGVTRLANMFETTPFNGNISKWDVSKVTVFSNMFRTATSFDQNLGAWDVGAGTNFNNMFNGANTMSVGNLDALLVGWDNAHTGTISIRLPAGSVRSNNTEVDAAVSGFSFSTVTPTEAAAAPTLSFDTAPNLVISPQPATTYDRYEIWYADSEDATRWGMWALNWPSADTTINLTDDGSKANCESGRSGTLCFRKYGTQIAGEAKWYRVIGYVSGGSRTSTGDPFQANWVEDGLGGDLEAPAVVAPKPQPTTQTVSSSVSLKAVKKASKLKMNVNPNWADGNYRVKVQKRGNGKWRTVKTVYTKGTKDTKVVNRKAGKYRVVLPGGQNGTGKSTSQAVRLRR